MNKREFDNLIFYMNRFENVNKSDIPALIKTCTALSKYLPLLEVDLMIHTLENDYLAITDKEQIVIGRDLIVEIIQMLNAIPR